MVPEAGPALETPSNAQHVLEADRRYEKGCGHSDGGVRIRLRDLCQPRSWTRDRLRASNEAGWHWFRNWRLRLLDCSSRPDRSALGPSSKANAVHSAIGVRPIVVHPCHRRCHLSLDDLCIRALASHRRGDRHLLGAGCGTGASHSGSSLPSWQQLCSASRCWAHSPHISTRDGTPTKSLQRVVN